MSGARAKRANGETESQGVTGNNRTRPLAHTPGPWRHAERANFSNIVEGPSGRIAHDGDDGYRPIAAVQSCIEHHRDPGAADLNRDANIRLIAAAPDLLDALKSTLALLKVFTRETDAVAKAVRDEAEIAIAKATGRPRWYCQRDTQISTTTRLGAVP